MVEDVVSLKLYADSRRLQVLFVGGDSADYLGMSVLNGLLSLPGVDTTTYPPAELTFQGNRDRYQGDVRGNAFTYFFLNEKPARSRLHVQYGDLSEFDAVIFSDIHNCFGLFVQFYSRLKRTPKVILDGSDSPVPYPYAGQYWRNPHYWFLPRANKIPYFKREWTEETIRYRYFRLLPRALAKLAPCLMDLRPISFGFPESKIMNVATEKTQLFASHCVDSEVSKALGKTNGYCFNTEETYYSDLKSSKFGVTTKRSGWDCLRHYEIAGNGAVPCFRDLDEKPNTCAPHGLVDGTNCVVYKNAADLLQKVKMSDEQYSRLREGALVWVRNHTCQKIARSVLDAALDIRLANKKTS